jgi:MFS family permease
VDQQERHVVPLSQGEPAQEPREAEGVTPLRPKTVSYAVYMALTGLAVRAVLITVSLVTGQLGAEAHPALAFFLGLMAAGFVAFEAWLIHGVWLGRNRRRILYMVWIASATVFNLANGAWAQAWIVQPARTAVGLLATGIELVAVVLLVLPISNAWFREMRAARAGEQAAQRNQRSPQRRRWPTWLSELSPDRWVRRYTFGTPGISFAISLLASWLVFNLVLWLQQTNYPNYPFDPFLNVMYAMSCLPAQAIALILGAAIGAVSTRIPEERWRRATYGVWTAGLIAIVSAVVGAGILPRSGS